MGHEGGGAWAAVARRVARSVETRSGELVPNAMFFILIRFIFMRVYDKTMCDAML